MRIDNSHQKNISGEKNKLIVLFYVIRENKGKLNTFQWEFRLLQREKRKSHKSEEITGFN